MSCWYELYMQFSYTIDGLTRRVKRQVIHCLGITGNKIELRLMYEIFTLLSDDVSYLLDRSGHRPK
jgi:hypothetical protein